MHHPALRVASADGWSENYARHRNARFAIALFTRTERYSIEFVSWKRGVSFRFRQSVKLFPGVRLNLSLSGLSVSVGGPGATLNLGPRGGAVTLGLPGTGLSYRHHFPIIASESHRELGVPTSPPATRLDPADRPLPGEIKSAALAELTSPDLEGLKKLIREASSQKASLEPLYRDALQNRMNAWRKLRRRQQLPLRLLMKRAIPRAKENFETSEAEAQSVADAINVSYVCVDFALGTDILEKYRHLQRAHQALSQSSYIWDVTSSVWIDRVKLRSAASTNVTRKLVRLSPVSDAIIAGDQVGMRFQNANGGDIDVFPGFMIMRSRSSSDFALVDLRNLVVNFNTCTFVEDEVRPSDATVIGHAWLRSNKDGSPDRRFSDNRQIPIMRYGEIHFATASGVSESYLFSNYEATQIFDTALKALQAALREQANTAPTHAAALNELVASRRPSDFRQLPVLPNVSGAHEYSLIAAAVIAAAGAVAYSPSVATSIWKRSASTTVSSQQTSTSYSLTTSLAPTSNPNVVRSGTIEPAMISSDCTQDGHNGTVDGCHEGVDHNAAGKIAGGP